MPQQVPTVPSLLWPALQAVRELGGSVTIEEHDSAVASALGLSDELLSIPQGNGPRAKFNYRMAWARTWLKGIEALDNSSRGVWSLTPRGKRYEQGEITVAIREWRSRLRDERGQAATEGSTDGSEDEPTWTEQLLDRLQELSGAAFERLSQRLLREAGFVNVEVLGRSGDGGIDGVGHYRMSLVTFPIYFQCKRYRSTVPPREIRDFRGAMQGRGEKGLFVTTGTYTREAQREATRDGAPPIDLVDGARLCELLKQYRMGVAVTERVVEDVELRSTFFDQFE